jgi:hypothetical protein
MGETVRSDPAPEQLLRRTRELRLGLLRLHKTLLDGERTIYERVCCSGLMGMRQS